MSSTNIPTDVKTRLWVKSGGRCQYESCNTLLYRDDLTFAQMNLSYIAHIVGDSPDGPRGDDVLSKELSKDIENLMLLCDAHHRLIDREGLADHSVERLKKMKLDHETRIEMLTSIHPNRKSTFLLYGAKIGQQESPLNNRRAFEAMIPEFFPSSEHGVELSLANSSFVDHQTEYWTFQASNLKELYRERVAEPIRKGNIEHLSVFALAPQPLLMLLGSLIGDINRVQVYQLNREPQTWAWQSESDDIEYIIKKPQSHEGQPVLVLSLSANIENTAIIDREKSSIWELTIANPHNNFVQSKKHLRRFREAVRAILNEIKSIHGVSQVLHIYPAMPVSCSVEFGRVIMPKADLRMLIYDRNKTAGRFIPTIDLN